MFNATIVAIVEGLGQVYAVSFKNVIFGEIHGSEVVQGTCILEKKEKVEIRFVCTSAYMCISVRCTSAIKMPISVTSKAGYRSVTSSYDVWRAEHK